MPVSEKVYDSFEGREPRAHQDLDLDPRREVVLDTREQHYVRRDDDGTAIAVTRVTSSYRTGWRAREFRRWYRWSDDQVTVIRKVGQGRIVVMTRSRQGTRSQALWGREGYRYVQSRRDAFAGNTSFADLAVQELGYPVTFRDYYPLAEYYTDLTPDCDPAFLRAFEGVTDVRELVVRLYGKRAYRRSLVKAVAQAKVYNLYLSWCLRGRHIPVDWHVDYLRQTPRSDDEAAPHEYPRRLRQHLWGLSRRSVRRLMKEPLSTMQRHWIEDLSRVARCPEVTEADSWRDLHDKVMRRDRIRRRIEMDAKQARQVKAAQRRAEKHAERLADPAYAAMLGEREHQLELYEIERQRITTEALGERGRLYESARGALAGTTERGLTVRVARTSRQLLEWGDAMDNCIANYYQSIRGCSGLLLGAYLGEELLANAEVRMSEGGELSLSQLLGKRNQPLPELIRSDIVGHLEGAGVSTAGRWMG